MENITLSRTKVNEKNSVHNKNVQSEMGIDGIENPFDEYNMEQYGEFIPSLNSWILMDDQRKRIEEITEGDESLWKTKE